MNVGNINEATKGVGMRLMVQIAAFNAPETCATSKDDDETFDFVVFRLVAESAFCVSSVWTHFDFTQSGSVNRSAQRPHEPRTEISISRAEKRPAC